jgi:hypothetical protein
MIAAGMILAVVSAISFVVVLWIFLSAAPAARTAWPRSSPTPARFAALAADRRET